MGKMVITKTPLRISFAGGGTDLPEYYQRNGGAVVNTAINKYIFIVVNQRFDDNIRLSYSKTEIVGTVNELQHDLVRECLRMVEIDGGIEIVSIADIPSGTGLGSSSAFTVGVLNALYTYKGYNLSSEELAEKACEIEIERLRHPIGKQDQYAVACGALNFFGFHPDGRVSRERIWMDDSEFKKMDRKLMMFYTNVTRKANSILSEQKANTVIMLETLDAMKQQAEDLYTDMKINGFTERFADTLRHGWDMKKTLAGAISNPLIDEYYDKAISAGAKGGKLLGAGNGGFLLFYCNEEKQQAVRDALQLRELDFRPSPYGSRVVYFA